MELSKNKRNFLLITAIIAFLGPNGLYLYGLFSDPSLNEQALQNPVSLAFICEALMLLLLFLWYVYERTQSIRKVFFYLILSLIGSLAFSFPLFLYIDRRKES